MSNSFVAFFRPARFVVAFSLPFTAYSSDFVPIHWRRKKDVDGGITDEADEIDPKTINVWSVANFPFLMFWVFFGDWRALWFSVSRSLVAVDAHHTLIDIFPTSRVLSHQSLSIKVNFLSSIIGSVFFTFAGPISTWFDRAWVVPLQNSLLNSLEASWTRFVIEKLF